MPLYEYQCRACAHRFERIVKFSDAPLKTCPQCGKDAVEQLISAPAVQFKGSGWYVTDYARKSAPPASASSAKPEGGADSAAAKESGGSSAGPDAPASSGSAEKTSGSASSSGTAANSGSSPGSGGATGGTKKDGK